jgi:hypothetical protein
MRIHCSSPLLIGRSGDGSHAAVVVIFGLQFGCASRLVRKAGKWIEASQVATQIEALGNEAVRTDEDAAKLVALGPGEEGLILALQGCVGMVAAGLLMAKKARTKTVENCPVTGRQRGARIDADAERQPLMAANAQI